MRGKLFLFLTGVLVLVQLLLYTQLRKTNDRQWDAAVKDIDVRIATLQSNILETERKVKLMEKNKENVPKAILEGVKDPEKKFLQFLDYLENSELGSKEMQGAYKISNKPILKRKPVPLQKTDFAIQFQFLHPKKLESLLGYLLNQQQEYPLKVNHLEIKRMPEGKPQVFLDVSLLLPAKIQGMTSQNISGSNKIGG